MDEDLGSIALHDFRGNRRKGPQLWGFRGSFSARRTPAGRGCGGGVKKRMRMDDTYYSYDPKRKEGARGIAARIRRNKQVLVLAGLAVLFVLGYLGLAGPWATEDLQKDAKETLRQRILRQNGEHDVVVYSKTWCPYSKRVKRLFHEIGQDYKGEASCDQRAGCLGYS